MLDALVVSSPPGGGDRTAQAPEAEERLRAALDRVEALAPPWGWPERLAVAGVGLLLAAVALPWGSGFGDQPVVLAQAGRPGLFVVGAAVALVAVVVQLGVGRASPATPPVVGIAAGVTAVGSLLVREADGRALALLVPGRVAAVVGCVALVSAALSLDETARAARARTDRVLRAARKRLADDTGESVEDEVVERVAAEVLAVVGAPDRRGAWVVGALLCAGAGALALTGPWWRSAFDVTGPYRDLLDEGEVAVTVRSGVDILGAARSWVVGAVVLTAVGAVVWPGGRRAAPVVALAGVVVAASGAAAWASDEAAGSTSVAAAVVALGAAAAALAVAVWWSGSTGPARAGSLLVAAPGLLAVWPVDEREVPAAVTDGPYQVLAGAESDMSMSGFGAQDGYPVWVDGQPGVVAWAGAGADGDRRPVLWTVDDGRMEVRAVGPGSVPEDSVPVGFADGTVLFRARGDLAHLWPVGSPATAVPLPAGPGDLPVLGSDGATWIVTLPYRPQLGEEPTAPGPVHVTDVDEVLRRRGDRSGQPVDALADGPELPAGTLEVVPGQGEGEAFAVLEDRILALAADGSTRSVFGGAVDGACGFNGDAPANFVGSGRLALAAENEGRYDGGVEVGRRGYVATDGVLPDSSVVPLWTAEPAAGGGLWVALPVPADPVGGAHRLARITADGEVRVVDHPVPGIRFIAVDPADGDVLVVDHGGRLLQLDDPDVATTPLPPPPDDCYPEVPTVAPPARLTAVGGSPSPEPDAVLVDTAGTRLLARSSGAATEIVRLPVGGGEQVVAEVPGEVLALGPDGAGGAWWLESQDGAGDADEDEDDEVDAVAVHLRVDGGIDRGPSLPVGTGAFPIHIATYGAGDVPYVVDAHDTRPRQTDRGIGTVGDHRLRRIVGGRVEVVYDAAADAPVLADTGPEQSLAVTATGEVVSVDGGEVRRLVGDGFEPVAGSDPDEVAAESARPLPVHLAAATPPDEIPVVGDMVADPAGGGVLVAQDGLLVRIGLDGTFAPVAQDPRLDDVDLAVLDGRVVATDADGRPFLVEVGT